MASKKHLVRFSKPLLEGIYVALQRSDFNTAMALIESLRLRIEPECKLREIQAKREKSVEEILRDHGECENCG